jgi:RND family efflux transporter MFP subunit
MKPASLAAALLFALALDVQAEVELKGWLEWVHEVQMRVVENGVVEEVTVSPGQRVEKGELLLRMDQREAQATLLEAKARVARAQVASEKAERALGRAQELFDRGLIAVEELKDAQLERVAATAEEEAAKAAEAVATVALERTELRAPFDGIVVARNVWNGAVIYKTLQQEPLIVVAPDDRMLARALVTAGMLRRFKLGQRVQVRINGALRQASIYSQGVESVRVEREGSVYYLDAIFDLLPNELLRPSETVQIIAR